MIAIEHITSKETIIWADVRGEKRRFHVKGFPPFLSA